MDDETTSDRVSPAETEQIEELEGTDVTEEQGSEEYEEEKQQEITRDSRGHWLKGKSGNSRGAPKKPSITKAIERMLEKIEPSSQKTWLELIVARIMNSAVIDGDITILKAIWNYIDGMPKIVAEVKQISKYDESLDVLGEIIEERRKLVAKNEQTPIQPVSDK